MIKDACTEENFQTVLRIPDGVCVCVCVYVHDMNYIVVKNRPGQNKLNKFKRTERGRSRPTRDVYAFSRRSAIIDRHLFSP